jgi:DNA-binding protein HU-beta
MEDIFIMANKQDLIAEVAAKTGLTKKDSEKAVNAFGEVVTEFLAKGEKVQLIGFGTFETRERAAREGRNPQTGEAIKIAATVVPAFKAGKALKDAVK